MPLFAETIDIKRVVNMFIDIIMYVSGFEFNGHQSPLATDTGDWQLKTHSKVACLVTNLKKKKKN